MTPAPSTASVGTPSSRRGGAAKSAGPAARAPAVGFVSLGCPKALVDSERIITELKLRGYAIAPDYQEADLVVVNTCGFIDSAIDESLSAIGEALDQNGRVVVTGCLGMHPDRIRARHPKVLAITGPHATLEVLSAVNAHLPQPHDPLRGPASPAGDPAHAAPLRVPEDLRGLQQQVQLLHHPGVARTPRQPAAG